MIEIEDLRHGVLDIPSLGIPPGLTAVSGRNGAGKTTLLKICSGLLLPDSGSVKIDGVEPRMQNAGYVSEFPDRHLLFGIVYDEIASTLRFARLAADEIDRRVRQTAEEAGILHLLDRECRTLSGGEKMLVGITAAIIDDPVLLVLDEPDSHLDPVTAEEFLAFVSSRKIPYVLWSSHSRTLLSNAEAEVRL